ncbi:hypothetical protein VTL71DRAFT_2173 [Oculimacula yallundae]|uniref:Ras-associating domain-containing protein n=1 Tax=Oculimacula yallundae TaxID=86028 RepID=A0ABR4C8W0_9HELO
MPSTTFSLKCAPAVPRETLCNQASIHSIVSTNAAASALHLSSKGSRPAFLELRIPSITVVIVMASLGALIRSCLETFKSILTSQDFGSEYELLCTELSVQWLRFRLWGESVGLHFDQDGRLGEQVSNRSDIGSTIKSCVNSIAFLLSEIETIRRKYELRPPLELISNKAPSIGKSLRKSFSLSRLSSITVVTSLRQRMRDNQKQKSFIAITKWAFCDAKRFEEKVKRLKGLIDGLEDVSKLANAPQQSPRSRSSTLPSSERPPPYSFTAPLERVQNDNPGPVIVQIPRSCTARQGTELPNHYANLKRYVEQTMPNAEVRRVIAREKLVKLSNVQLHQFRVDVNDELSRREQQRPNTPYLLPNLMYQPKRNQAREKISTLSANRFRDLTMDLVSELERRYPYLWFQTVPGSEQAGHQINSLSIPRDPRTKRYGYVLPPNTPPPLLRYRATKRISLPHPQTPALNFSRPALSSRFSTHAATSTTKLTTLTPPPRQSSTSSVEIFKSFRVSMEDPCYKVLPAALKKYNINAPWENYALYIVYEDKERCLGMEEKPLILFKQLDKMGKKPMFMLRKIGPSRHEHDGLKQNDPPGGII